MSEVRKALGDDDQSVPAQEKPRTLVMVLTTKVNWDSNHYQGILAGKGGYFPRLGNVLERWDYNDISVHFVTGGSVCLTTNLFSCLCLGTTEPRCDITGISLKVALKPIHSLTH